MEARGAYALHRFSARGVPDLIEHENPGYLDRAVHLSGSGSQHVHHHQKQDQGEPDINRLGMAPRIFC
jgi:hypothetical protein